MSAPSAEEYNLNSKVPPTTINQNTNEKNAEVDTNKIILEIKKEMNDKEKDRIIREQQEKIQDLQYNRLLSIIKDVKDNQNRQNSNININTNTNINNNNNISAPLVIVSSKLVIPGVYLCLFVLFNIFLPGIGTIVAGILYGKTALSGDRTGIVICHGVIQLLTCWIIVGWIWAIIDTVRSFEEGSCG